MPAPSQVVVPVLLAVAVLATAGSCSSDGDDVTPTGGTSTTAAATGVLRGRLVMVGGPAPGRAEPLTGTVTVTGPGGRHSVDVGPDGLWSLTLSAGRYTVEGRSPQIDSGARPCVVPTSVTVVAGGTARADAVCPIR